MQLVYLILFAMAYVWGGQPSPQDSPVRIVCQFLPSIAWREENNDFYRALRRDGFDAISQHKGMHRHCDLRRLDEIWRANKKNPRSISVIGGGRRDIGYLRFHSPALEIVNFQVSDVHAKEVEDELGTLSKSVQEARMEAGLPPQEIFNYWNNIGLPFSTRVVQSQVAYWLFAGALELTPREKTQAASNLAAIVEQGGYLAIDIPVGAITSTLKLTPTSRGRLDIRLRAPNDSSDSPPVVHYYPIRPDLTVDEPKLIEYFTKTGKFASAVDLILTNDGIYFTDSTPPGMRKFIFLKRLLIP